MTPWQRAKQWQDQHDPTANFGELLGAHLSGGYIWSTPQVFMLASEERWNVEDRQFESGESNCWFVRLAGAIGHANAIGELLRVAPHPHDYVAWCRRGGLPRVYSWEKLTRNVRR